MTRSVSLIKLYNDAKQRVYENALTDAFIEYVKISDKIVNEYEITVKQNLNIEESIHRMTKLTERILKS